MYRSAIEFPREAKEETFALLDHMIIKLKRETDDERRAQLKLPKAFQDWDDYVDLKK